MGSTTIVDHEPSPSASATPLSPTERTRVRRARERAEEERAALHEVLTAGLVCHLGVVVDGAPVVIPTVYGVDRDGPDRDGTLYLHGSVAARSLLAAPDATIWVTVTLLDGLVLARSAFHHSMNYRSAMVIGTPRVVTDPDERERALTAIVDQVVPGRAGTLRAHTRKELAATRVLALPLYEASVKARRGDVSDDPEDIRPDVWRGPGRDRPRQPAAHDRLPTRRSRAGRCRGDRGPVPRLSPTCRCGRRPTRTRPGR